MSFKLLQLHFLSTLVILDTKIAITHDLVIIKLIQLSLLQLFSLLLILKQCKMVKIAILKESKGNMCETRT